MHIRNIHIFLLSWTAGGLNAISYIGLGGVFTANMTGNTVLLGIALAERNAPKILLSGTAVLGFCAGVFGGGLCIAWKDKRLLWTRRRTFVLVLDTALLVCFALIWLLAGWELHPGISWLLLLLACLAMGQQSALALSLAFPGVATTYFTGTLTNLMAGLARVFHVAIYPRPDETESMEAAATEHNLGRLALMWLVFALASMVSSVLFEHVPWIGVCDPLIANLLIVLDVLLVGRLWRRR